MPRWFDLDLNAPCCPDFSKSVCFRCNHNVRLRLSILAHNLAIAGGLWEAWNRSALNLLGYNDWTPGCEVDQ